MIGKRNDRGGPILDEDDDPALVSDPVIRSVLEETLEREGYTVLATGDLGRR